MGNIEGGPEISNPFNSFVKKYRLKKEEIEREPATKRKFTVTLFWAWKPVHCMGQII